MRQRGGVRPRALAGDAHSEHGDGLAHDSDDQFDRGREESNELKAAHLVLHSVDVKGE